MSKTEAVIAFLLILAGVVCLTMSGGLLVYPGAAAFLETFAKVCLWTALPLIGVVLLYWRSGRKNRR